MLGRKVPLYTLAVAWLLGAGGCFALMSHRANKHGLRLAPDPVSIVAEPEACDYRIRRVEGFDLVRPLLYAEPVCEAPRLLTLKVALEKAIETARTQGTITSASVYVRDFNRAEWISVNGTEQYDPGSLLKVPMMITLLKMAEVDPTLFARPCSMTDLPELPRPSFLPSKQIELGKYYTIPQLLTYAIEWSDNLASTLLFRQMDFDQFRQMMNNVGLSDVSMGDSNYPLTAPEYAQFLKAIYNSSFLSPHSSDFAMRHLVKCEFDKGIRAGVPGRVEVAHKFGESGPDELRQFHDAGVVFDDRDPYLIVVMTRGRDIHALPGFVAGISSMVYNGIASAENGD